MTNTQPDRSLPSLPQNDPKGRSYREEQLQQAQSVYTYAHSYTYIDVSTQEPLMIDGQPAVLAPIAVLTPAKEVPAGQGLNLVQIFQLAQSSIVLLTNFTVKLTNLVGVGAVGTDVSMTVQHVEKLHSLLEALSRAATRLDHLTTAVHQAMARPTAQPSAATSDKRPGLMHTLLEDLASDVADAEHDVGPWAAKAARRLSAELHDTLGKAFETFVEALADEVAKEVLRRAGLYGEPASMFEFADQFQTFVGPSVMSTTMSDAAFARMRVAGPNPVVLQGITALPAKFPVSNAKFQRVMGAADSVEDAGKEGRLYLADFVALASMKPGQFPVQKYVGAPLALFAVPREGSLRALKPVAIQCSQEPGAGSPIFYPDDGTSWELAKIWVEVADGNYEELISHLGLTHMLVEPFAVTTHRQLAPEHPLYVLLQPHFQGTLFINNAAVFHLIRPNGLVDRLLGGVISSDWAVTTSALTGLDFNQAMLPASLAARRVDDARALPDYPYRDDGLLLWNAIKTWVGQYLDLYYTSDDDVRADPELQRWYRELVSQEGGCVCGLGEPDAHGSKGLFTRGYLTDVVTMIIFTSSVQHAAVNFPQRTVMSYTPAMPLASYTAAPDGQPRDGAALAQLPPLEQAAFQLMLGQFLGSVYFTRLGQYDLHQPRSYFADPRVKKPLAAFQKALVEVEQAINARNLERPTYDVMLPSRVPQSINI